MPETDRQVLDKFLHPIQVDHFLADFTRRVILIKGTASKFAGMLDVQKLQRIIDAFADKNDGMVRASFPKSTLSYLSITASQAKPLYEGGATICVTAINKYDPELARFAAAIKGELNFTGLVSLNCYWSPDGSGFGTHYDARTATTLQIDGSKWWRFSREPWTTLPTRNALFDKVNNRVTFETPVALPWENTAVPDESTFEQVLLEPGDVFSLPAGCWHSAAASGHSLALNLAFEARSFLDVVVEEVVTELRQDPTFRQALPMGLDQGESLPPEVRSHVARLLEGLRTRVNKLDVDDPAILDSWRSAVTTVTGNAYRPRPNKIPVEPEQKFLVRRVAPRKLALETDEGKERVVLFYNGTKISLPAKARPVFETLLAQESFTASDAMSWGAGYKWLQLEPLFDQLLNCGVIERITR